jgi:asparagine synthase (glutamine-hydrolysing)
VPGLLGQAGGQDDASSLRFGAALDRAKRHPRLAVRSCAGTAWRVAHLSLDPPAPDDAGAPAQVRAVFHGVLHNRNALRAQLAAPVAGTTEALVAALYQAHGPGFASRLEGEFCLAVVDEAARRIVLAADAIGTHPLYWHAGPGGLVFGSDLSAVLRALPAPPRLNLHAVADYLTIGLVLGDKTLAGDVQLLGPATTLIYDLENRTATTREYLPLASLFEQRWTDRDAWMEALQSAFADAVRSAVEGTKPIGLSLSGGLDSRAILAAVNGGTSEIRTYTLGVDGCADQAIAARLSRIAGTRHRYFTLDRSYLRDFLPNMAEMVALTDGMYLSHGLTEMLAVRFIEQTDIGVLLRGHGGELAKAHLAWPLYTDAHVHQMTSTGGLVPYILERDNLIYVKSDLPLSRLLTPDALRRAGTGAFESLALLVANTSLSAAECCSYLYLREFTRRFTIPSLEPFRTRVDVRLPYLDARFLRVLLGAPAAWRDSTAVHQRLTRAGLPRLARVRNSNTGAAADAGPLAEFVFDKLNTALKRLNVRGYRHYHNFDDWMRSGLLDSVEAELLAPSARVRSFVEATTVKELIRQTRGGGADRSYLLQVLLILELWLRDNRIGDAA